MAASKAGSISIGCTGGADEGIGDVYGGANQANITGDIALNIAGGSIQRLFGGNNASGNISGSITVNVDWDTNKSCGNNYLGTVYGGGNQAAYTAPTTGTYTGLYPEVNIIHGTVENDVFGGGLGATAVVTGNPVVTVGKPTTVIPAANQTITTPDPSPNTYWSTVGNNVYGGGNAAQVSGNTKVLIINKTIVDGNVYGGGNAAGVTGSTDVQIGD